MMFPFVVFVVGVQWSTSWLIVVLLCIVEGVLITYLLKERKRRKLNDNGLIVDFEERKQAQGTLAENERHLREAQSLAHIGSFRWDVARNTVDWSDELYRVYGLTRGDCEITYHTYLNYVHPKHKAQVREAVEQSVKALRPFGHEYRIVRPDGEVRWVFGKGQPVTDGEGNLIALQGVCQDITERKHAEEALRESEQDLLKLTTRLLNLQDEERRRIALDLHDGTLQNLAAVALNLARLRDRKDWSPEVTQVLAECHSLFQESIEEIRTLSYILHPPMLDHAGLLAALQWYIEGFTRRSQIRIDLVLPENVGRLRPEIEGTLFRVVQESLTNILRHSGSETASIRLEKRPDEIVLEIKDQGHGLSPSQELISSDSLPEVGVGIPGMRQRLRQLGGRLEIESDSGGTKVTAVVPLSEDPITARS